MLAAGDFKYEIKPRPPREMVEIIRGPQASGRTKAWISRCRSVLRKDDFLVVFDFSGAWKGGALFEKLSGVCEILVAWPSPDRVIDAIKLLDGRQQNITVVLDDAECLGFSSRQWGALIAAAHLSQVSLIIVLPEGIDSGLTLTNLSRPMQILSLSRLPASRKTPRSGSFL